MGVSALTDDHIRVIDGRLFVEGCDVGTLAARHGTPLFVISEHTLRDNYRRLAGAFGARWPRPVHLLYAIKANFALAIAAVLAREGAGADVFTEGEVHAALMAGISPRGIRVNGSLKSTDLLTQAISCGGRVNIDAVAEFEAIESIARRLGVTAEVNIRAKPDFTELDNYTSVPSPYHGGEKIGIGQWILENKWGMTVDEGIEVVRATMRSDSVSLIGVHSHIGRHHASAEMFGDMAPGLVRWIEAVSKATGWRPATLDVGGGFTQGRDPLFRSGKDPDPPAPEIDVVAATMCDCLLAELSARDLPIPELELEPGRFLTTSAGILLATVGTQKTQPGVAWGKWVNVDASVAHFPGPEFFEARHEIVVVDHADEDETETYALVGPSCYEDVLGFGRPLPRVRPGDVVAFLDAGGYADVFASNVNAIPRPGTVLVSGNLAEVTRRHETVLDIFARDTIPPRLFRPDAAAM